MDFNAGLTNGSVKMQGEETAKGMPKEVFEDIPVRFSSYVYTLTSSLCLGLWRLRRLLFHDLLIYFCLFVDLGMLIFLAL